MTAPRVTVAVTTRNRAALVVEAVESALALRGDDLEVEVLVVDDGSTDDTLARLAGLDVRVHSTGGVGMAAARDAAKQIATGDFIQWLDDDDVLLPDAIRAQLREHARRPEHVVVFGRAQPATMAGEPIGDPFPDPGATSGDIFDDVLTYFPQIATALVRLDAAIDNGGFDPTLTGDNDWDWFLRLVRGRSAGRVDEPVVLFRQRDDAEVALAWRRFPAMVTIFRRHTRALPLRDRIRLEPGLWRHRGWWAARFTHFARLSWRDGDRRAAIRSIGYALRASTPHTIASAARGVLSKGRS